MGQKPFNKQHRMKLIHFTSNKKKVNESMIKKEKREEKEIRSILFYHWSFTIESYHKATEKKIVDWKIRDCFVLYIKCEVKTNREFNIFIQFICFINSHFTVSATKHKTNICFISICAHSVHRRVGGIKKRNWF